MLQRWTHDDDLYRLISSLYYYKLMLVQQNFITSSLLVGLWITMYAHCGILSEDIVNKYQI